jgi:hypothetical protein
MTASSFHATTARLARLAAFIAVTGAHGWAAAADIHMSPTGDDARDGATAATAVATLQRAFQLALTHPRKKSEPMRVLVGTGTYKAQSIVLDGAQLGYELTLVGAGKEAKEFPVFLGDGEQRTWMTVKSDRGHRTGLTIQALEIRNYATAISLEGNRDSADRSNGGTTIRRNVFSNIGSVALRDDDFSTAAIRLVNSTDNVVENNYFNSIRNKNIKQCGALHALYLAHFSSRNRITNNTFNDTCGSVVKFRDRSNDNIVEGNRFIKIENAPAIEEWYCDKESRKDCTKKLGECPSTGNVQRHNAQTDSPGSKLISVSTQTSPRNWCAKEDFARERVSSN